MVWWRKRTVPDQLSIAMICRRLPSAGRSTGVPFVRLIARGLAYRGHRVVLITGDELLRSSASNDGVDTVKLSSPRSSALFRDRSPRAFSEIVRDKVIELNEAKKFHILHGLDDSVMELGPLKKRLGVSLAYDVQATHLSDLFAILGLGTGTAGGLIQTGLSVAARFISTYYSHDRWLLRSADGVFVSSPRERLALERYYSYPDLRIHTVPYGVELHDLPGKELVDATRRKYQLKADSQIIVTVSDMNEVGEMTSLLYAFERIAVKRPNVRLMIIGHGPFFHQLEYLALSLALGNRVIFTGALSGPETLGVISIAEAFVNLSARSSGFEPSALEAMMQKKVVIGSEVSPIAAFIEHGVDGFLVRPADVQELTALMLALVDGKVQSRTLGESAREKVARLFDPERMVVETLRAYRTILANPLR